MTDKPIEPLFAYPDIEGVFKIGRMARLVVDAGENESAAATQLRGFAQRRLIEPRAVIGRESPTAHNLYGWPDLVTAKILRTLIALGVGDREIMQSASLACYAWRKWQNATAPHPIYAAMVGTVRGEYWYFGLDVATDPETGQRQIHARVHEGSEPLPAGDPMVNQIPAGSIVIPIFRFLPAMIERHNAIKNADA